ncbi:beta-1,4-N-acetylgalactosaminyltransferase bre-4-like isoform X2 [Rhipicephalus microplus]|uniref:beta-1,4-N-acetylgalactosaminyltransferase bre-4-like isoform X2 n=1 Tax=Rhipicephalus microplus TaxID=6941 RepID=UPI003F6CD958
MKAPITAVINGRVLGSRMPAVLRVTSRNLAFKLSAGCALVYVLAIVFLELSGYKETVSKATSQDSVVGNQTMVAAKRQRTSVWNQSDAITGVPRDVFSDSLRANPSAPEMCPPVSPNLIGYIEPKLNVSSLDAVEAEFPYLMPGGHFRPKECTSRHRVAILIPYRNREDNLKVFIYNIHRVLARQQIDYSVFVIEQGDTKDFNRAKLLNVGFLQSTALYDYRCFVFHDVDLVPVDDRNVYTCPQQPRHMSVWIDNRTGLKHINETILRRPANIARYKSLSHALSKRNKQRIRILRKWKARYLTDGLNSVKYKVLNMEFKKLYTWILVDLRD